MLGLPPDAELPADEELWRLTKGTRVAVLWQSLHPLGIELRLDVNGETMRTHVQRSVEEARAAREAMRAAMLAKGWGVIA